MTTEEDFLAVLKANPADDTARLVYADWLEEYGDDARAAYLRAAVGMVQLCGDGRPDGPAVEELLRLAEPLPEGWRIGAAGRFSAVLYGCRASHKINTIKLIREATGAGITESTRLCESSPVKLADRVSFETAHSVQSHVQKGGYAVVRLLPSYADLADAGVTYRIVAWCYNLSVNDDRWEGLRITQEEASAEFGEIVAEALGTSSDGLGNRVTRDRAVLAAGLGPGEVPEQLRLFRGRIPRTARSNRLSLKVYSEPEAELS